MPDEIKVDPEFKALIPPLSPDERAGLERDIVDDGMAYVPIVVWNGLILDGHNRFEICTRHKLPYQTTQAPTRIDDRRAARMWIRSTSLNRRNLGPVTRAQLAYGNEQELAAQAKERQREHGQTAPGKSRTLGKDFSQVIERAPKTVETAAAQAGMSHPTYRAALSIAEKGTEALRRAVDSHEVSVVAGAKIAKLAADRQDSALSALNRGDKAHVAQATGEYEWYSPTDIVDLARSVMGGIGLDPASSKTANSKIRADQIYTADDDGLTHPWHGRVWMNPPYAKGLIDKFCAKLREEYEARRVCDAIVLVNNATETAWFQDLAEVASAVCFPRGRVVFWGPVERGSTALQGQAILYLGDQSEDFCSRFSRIGTTWRKP